MQEIFSKLHQLIGSTRSSGTYGNIKCTLSNGTISSCASPVASTNQVYGVALNDNNSFLYNTSNSTNNLTRFTVNSTTGDLSTEAVYPSVINNDTLGMTINYDSTYMFVMTENKYLYQCPIDNSGDIGLCISTTDGIQFTQANSVALWNPG